MTDEPVVVKGETIPCSSEIGNAPLEYLESSTQYDMNSKDMSSIGTQVDIRSLVSESELNKEESAEIFWQKMAEQSKAALEEARDENKKLHITIDFLARQNVQYQRMIDDLKGNPDQEENADEEVSADQEEIAYQDENADQFENEEGAVVYEDSLDDIFGGSPISMYIDCRNDEFSISL